MKGFVVSRIAPFAYISLPLAFLSLLLLILPCSCTGAPAVNAAAKAGTPAPPPPAVIVEEVQQQTVHIPAEFVARTSADQTVEIRARVEGVLIESSFDEGRPVKKDQILFRIDPAVYEAGLQTAKAQLAKANADLQLAKEQVSLKSAEAQLKQMQASLIKADQDVARMEPLAREEAVPQQELDAAVAQQKVAQANVDAAQANKENVALSQKVSIEQAQAAIEAGKAAVAKAEIDLSYTVIHAPIDGLIGKKEVSLGNLVGRGEPTLLATVSTTEPMRVDFSISELDYLQFMERRKAREAGGAGAGEELELILADGTVYPGKGTVIMVERGLDPTTATIPLGASFPNPDGLLRPGMFARVRASGRKIDNALLVPQKAVVELQGAKTVLVVDGDNKVAVKTLGLGDRYDKYYVVLAGELKPGDRVIVEGQQKVRPGAPVTLTAAAKAPEGK